VSEYAVCCIYMRQCPLPNDLARPDALSWSWAIFNGRCPRVRARASLERRSEKRRLSLKIARITVAGLAGCGPLGALGIDETQLKSRYRRPPPPRKRSRAHACGPDDQGPGKLSRHRTLVGQDSMSISKIICQRTVSRKSSFRQNRTSMSRAR
jgi:hypothetical protein